jgi:hypothetical protein
MTIPVSSPIVVTVTPQASPAVTLNTITVGPINQPSVAYTHTQGTSSATWVVNHYLGWNPNVTVQDSALTTVEGNVIYTNNNSLTITFSGAFSGKAYLS